jgi:hypothetical protein
VLASPRKSDGRPNFHAWGYVEIARAYRRDALVALRAAPGTYVTAVRRAWRTYLRPTTEYEGVAEARARVGRWADAYEALLYGRVALPRRQMPYYLTLLLGLPALFVWGVRVARRAQAGPIALDAGAHAIVILALLRWSCWRCCSSAGGARGRPRPIGGRIRARERLARQEGCPWISAS